MPVLTLSLLYLIYAVVLNLLVLFNGFFPLFGALVFGLVGIMLIELSTTCLLLLAWGLVRLQTWAGCGSVVFVGALEFLAGVPAQGYHFALLAGVPLVATWTLVIAARRHIRGQGTAATASQHD